MDETAKENIKVTSREAAPGIWEVAVEGSLDWTNFAEVDLAFEELFKKGIYRVIVNLEATKYIASAGFGSFISALSKATENRGDLIVAACPAEIMDVFNILGLRSVLKFADTVKEAIPQLR